MAVTTPEELAQLILVECTIVDQTETAADEDIDGVANAYRAKFEELAAPAGTRELIYWPIEEIPAAVVLIMRDLITNEIAGGYGDPMDPITKMNNETIILKRLRQHVTKTASGMPTRGEYF